MKIIINPKTSVIPINPLAEDIGAVFYLIWAIRVFPNVRVHLNMKWQSDLNLVRPLDFLLRLWWLHCITVFLFRGPSYVILISWPQQQYPYGLIGLFKFELTQKKNFCYMKHVVTDFLNKEQWGTFFYQIRLI